MIYSTSIPLIKGAATWGAWRGGEVSLFAGSFGGTVESCCLCLGLWSPLSTCALWGAGALATAPLLFLLVSTKLLLLEDCRTSVIKNKNESCFTYPTPKSTWKSCVHECRGCTHPPHPPLPLVPPPSCGRKALLSVHLTQSIQRHSFCPKPTQAYAGKSTHMRNEPKQAKMPRLNLVASGK